MIRLRELRLQQGLTMKQVGADLGLAESTISLYENEKRQPDFATLAKFADYYGVTTDFLLGRSDLRSPAPKSSSIDEEKEILRYLQQIKDDPSTRMMFDLAKGATLEEIKATVAFLKALREQE